MTTTSLKSYLFLLFIVIVSSSLAQPNSVGIIIKNQPDSLIFLGLVKGDSFIVVDSAYAENELVRFNMPDSSQKGMYRLILGYTQYAKVTKEAPQQIDFIFNNEDIVFETDFKSPESKTRVIESNENKIWFRFKAKENEFAKQLSVLEKDVNYYWEKKLTGLVTEKANEYNRIQIDRDLYIAEMVNQSENLFVSKLIETYKEPLLDGYLSKEQRREIFQKDFLKTVNFTHESLINTQAYTDKIFQYLLSFNQSEFNQQQREESYMKAVDIIFELTNKNDEVANFIKEYLIHGFGVLKLENVIDYVNDRYSN